MDIPERLILNPVPQPTPQVHRAAFGLEHRYLERCWAPVIGPTSILLLRRASALWQEQAPASVDVGELSASLGLASGTGRSAPLRHTLDRVVRFRVAAWSGPGEIDVYTEVPLLSEPISMTARLGRSAGSVGLPPTTPSRHCQIEEDETRHRVPHQRHQ